MMGRETATKTGFWGLIVVGLAAMAAGMTEAGAAGLSARAQVSANSVFVDEPFRLQIQVSGSEDPKSPDFTKMRDFVVRRLSGGANSRTSVSVVNGQMTRTVQLGYVFNFELRAKREGRLTIPAFAIEADGQTAMTQAVVVVAQKPSETENFKLRLSLSQERAFVGEQLVIEAIFYFRANVSEPQLTIPIMDHPAFEVHALGNDEQRRGEVLDGEQFNTLRVRKVLVPRRAGSFPVPPATLSFKGVDGVEIGEDFFGRRVRQPKYKAFVIPSNPLDLQVDPLPTEGRPANFAGHVGEFALSVQANPTEMNVGDPITLTISVAGPALLAPVELPPLNRQESLTRDFKVPTEIEEGEVHGTYKVFTQTVRALRDEVAEIPPIELPYFDTARGTYEVARSEAVPIVVKATKILTAGDIEGLGPLSGAQQEVQSWMQGIAHNYAGDDVLARQVLGFAGLASPARLALVAGPPLVYAVLLALVVIRRKRHANPDSLRARRALGGFTRVVPGAGSAEEILEAFRGFLGDKLALTSDALTFRDVEEPLRLHGVGETELAQVGTLFEEGEASRYAGAGTGGNVGELRGQAVELARKLERAIR